MQQAEGLGPGGWLALEFFMFTLLSLIWEVQLLFQGLPTSSFFLNLLDPASFWSFACFMF